MIVSVLGAKGEKMADIADKLISSFNIISTLVHKYGRNCSEAVLEIDEQPEAVVRCKDCKFHKNGYCLGTGHFDMPTEDDGFCSWGEREKMADILCTDNRFELIAKYKAKLLDSTNIEGNPKEMAVIDNILFRFWQMGWLDKLESVEAEPVVHCKDCMYFIDNFRYCENDVWVTEKETCYCHWGRRRKDATSD